jgi:hypothetical protein
LFLSRFWAFRNKGSSKTRENKSKSPSGLITKKSFFSRPFSFFSPSVVLLDLFYRVYGRFVTRGVKDAIKKIAEIFPQSAVAKKSSYPGT